MPRVCSASIRYPTPQYVQSHDSPDQNGASVSPLSESLKVAFVAAHEAGVRVMGSAEASEGTTTSANARTRPRSFIVCISLEPLESSLQQTFNAFRGDS